MTAATHATRELLDPEEVCTLVTEALAERISWIRGEILPHVAEREVLEDGLAFELRAETGLAEKVDHLIELEKSCCGGISFERLPSDAPERLRLEIRGIDPKASLLLREEAGSEGQVASSRGRLAGALAVGGAGSLFVCCVLPLGIGAVAGAAAAAPFARLDAPLPIVFAALLGAGATWWWQGQRA